MNGLLGKKIGMTQIFDEKGNVERVSVLEAGPCFVTQVKTKATDGYNAVQIGFGAAKDLTKPMQGHLKDKKLKHLREFKVDKPEDYAVGLELKAELFQIGDELAVSGNGVGKGFAGVIKRHHHHRGPMSHGSKSHRLTGSIGAGTTPGRVFKGRKMSGRMGGKRVTVPSLVVIKVLAEQNILLLRGTLPGKAGSILEVRRTKAAKKKEEKN